MNSILKITFLTCYMFLIVFCCNGQGSKVVSGDTLFWYKIRYDDGKKIGVEHLISSPYNFFFRLWKDGQIIDVWTANGVAFRGSVTSYTKSYESYDEKQRSQKSQEYFSKRVYLDPLIAKKAFELFRNIDSIPSDKSIKGWRQGVDGVEYNIETSTPLTYNFRNYWTPTAQDSSLLQAKRIQQFIVNLDTLLRLREKYNIFFADLMPGSYIGDGPGVAIKLTEIEKDYFKRTKPYRDYIHSINDTLNHYLRDTLTKIFTKYGSLKCYDEFRLQFSKENKLLKITTNDKLIDREDKTQFRQCKNKIWKAFRSIKIDFVHSQVDYSRELRFFDGKVTVRDGDWW